MTTGERLVELSTLNTGTASEHLQNIVLGDRIVLSSKELDIRIASPKTIRANLSKPVLQAKILCHD